MERLDGAARCDVGASRFGSFDEYVAFNGIDWSGDTFSAQIRQLPDSPGLLATISLGTPVYTGGATRFFMYLSKSGMLALPGANEPGENVVLHWDLIRTWNSNIRATVALYGTFTVYGGVTQ